jgi:coenzyme F420 hydrogenase subunit beta
MVDDLDAGRRPIVGRDLAGQHLPTLQALAACPGTGLSHGSHRSSDEIAELRSKWGPVLEVWEGYADDEQIRLAGSSGGVASALAVHCIEHEHMHGLLHIRGREDIPYLNETVLSTNRADILAATGSRYAPASPCDRLDLVTSAPAPCVFIGKPCDVGATSLLRATQPILDEKLGLTIAIFCAGTPTTRGTLEMLETMGIDNPESLVSLRYRGNGWPGDATARVALPDGSIEERKLSYDQSWGEVLQRHRQWRCYVCADHTGEFADISVGDPWYRAIGSGETGRSLILVRTERGRALLARALAAGSVSARRVDASLVPESQPGLVTIRGDVGGRIATLRLVGLPTPRFVGLPMFGTWLRELSLRAKLRSTLGTLRRIRRRRLHRRVPVRPAKTDRQ